jgi:hypothetical protein
VATQGVRQVSRIERDAPFLDDGVKLVQVGNYCYVEDPKFLARPWAVLSIEYLDDIAPTGWFWLHEVKWNKSTISDCVKHGLLEVDPYERVMSDGFNGKLARVIRG